MCEMFHVLPEPGALMDQPLWFLTMVAISHNGAKEPSQAQALEPLANIPMSVING